MKHAMPLHPVTLVITLARDEGITQNELAARMGMTYGTLHTALSRRSRITPLMAIRYSRAFRKHEVYSRPEQWLYKQADWDLYMQRVKGEE